MINLCRLAVSRIYSAIKSPIHLIPTKIEHFSVLPSGNFKLFAGMCNCQDFFILLCWGTVRRQDKYSSSFSVSKSAREKRDSKKNLLRKTGCRQEESPQGDWRRRLNPQKVEIVVKAFLRRITENRPLTFRFSDSL